MGFLDKAKAAANELAAKADTALSNSGLGGSGAAVSPEKLLRDLGVIGYLQTTPAPPAAATTPPPAGTVPPAPGGTVPPPAPVPPPAAPAETQPVAPPPPPSWMNKSEDG